MYARASSSWKNLYIAASEEPPCAYRVMIGRRNTYCTWKRSIPSQRWVSLPPNGGSVWPVMTQDTFGGNRGNWGNWGEEGEEGENTSSDGDVMGM